MCNDLQKLIIEFPNEKWSLNRLLQNPNITIEFARKHLKVTSRKAGKQLSCNPNTRIKDVKDNPDIKWYWTYLQRYANITIKDVKDSKKRLFMKSYSQNKNVKLQEIKNNLHLNWDYKSLSCNETITPDFIRQHLNKDWDWGRIFSNSNIPYAFYKDFEYKSPYTTIFRHSPLSYNPNTTIEIVKKEINNLHFDWYCLSCHPNITLEDITHNPGFNWKTCYILDNPNITIDHIKDDEYLTSFSTVYLGSNPGINMKDIKENKHLRWDFRCISLNPNLTFEFVKENIHENWNWETISSNSFNYKKNKKNTHALLIQKGCNNWLNKIKCRDSTYGIRPRIDLTKSELFGDLRYPNHAYKEHVKNMYNA